MNADRCLTCQVAKKSKKSKFCSGKCGFLHIRSILSSLPPPELKEIISSSLLEDYTLDNGIRPSTLKNANELLMRIERKRAVVDRFGGGGCAFDSSILTHDYTFPYEANSPLKGTMPCEDGNCQHQQWMDILKHSVCIDEMARLPRHTHLSTTRTEWSLQNHSILLFSQNETYGWASTLSLDSA